MSQHLLMSIVTVNSSILTPKIRYINAKKKSENFWAIYRTIISKDIVTLNTCPSPRVRESSGYVYVYNGYAIN